MRTQPPEEGRPDSLHVLMGALDLRSSDFLRELLLPRCLQAIHFPGQVHYTSQTFTMFSSSVAILVTIYVVWYNVYFRTRKFAI